MRSCRETLHCAPHNCITREYRLQQSLQLVEAVVLSLLTRLDYAIECCLHDSQSASLKNMDAIMKGLAEAIDSLRRILLKLFQ